MKMILLLSLTLLSLSSFACDFYEAIRLSVEEEVKKNPGGAYIYDFKAGYEPSPNDDSSILYKYTLKRHFSRGEDPLERVGIAKLDTERCEILEKIETYVY